MSPRVPATRARTMCRKTCRSGPQHERRSDGAGGVMGDDGMGDDGPKTAGGPDGRSGRRAALRAAVEGVGGRGAAE